MYFPFAQYCSRLQSRLAVAVCDRRIGTRGKQALDFLNIAADNGEVEESIAERALVIGIADSAGHFLGCYARGDS